MKPLKSFSFFLTLLIPVAVYGVSRSFPVVELRPTYSSFSPDGNGMQDFLSVELRVKSGNNIEIVDWEMSIYGPSGLVRTLLPDRRIKKQRFFGAVERAELPSFLYWDGRDERGQVQTDGRYRMELRLIHDYNRIERYSSREFWIRTAMPEIELKPIRLYLLRPPLGDGRLGPPGGEIVIEQITKKPVDGFHFTGQILNSTGQMVEVRQWTDSLPRRISWNGRMQDGSAAPPGVYRYELGWKDAAGNVKQTSISQLLVIAASRPPSTQLYTDSFFVNPASMMADGRSLSISYTGASRPVSLKLRVRESEGFSDANWRTLLEQKTSIGGANLLSQSTIFPAGARPGLYELAPGQGDSVSPVFLMLDGKRPVLGLRPGSGHYRPGDLLRIHMSYSDASPLNDFCLRVLVKTGAAWSILKEWRGTTLPAEILWNGDTDIDHALAAGETLILEFQATDVAGYTSVVRSDPFRTDVAFHPVQRDSVNVAANVSLSGNFSEEAISPSGYDLIRQILDEWKLLDGYRVRVRVFVSFQGEEEPNLLRSEILARKIRDELVELGIPPSGISFRGEGETDLYSEKTDEYSAYRNNRLRVELVREQKP